MNGLIEQQAQAGVQPQMQPQPQPGGNSHSLPPGVDHRQMDLFVANGMKLIHTQKISDAIVKQMKSAGNPVTAISGLTLNIVSQLEASAKAAGKKLSLTVLAYGANILMGEVINLAEAAGMKPISDEDKYQAFSLTVARYLDAAVKSGQMTKEEVMQLGKQMESSPEGQKILQTGRGLAQQEGQNNTPASPVPSAPGGQMSGGQTSEVSGGA